MVSRVMDREAGPVTGEAAGGGVEVCAGGEMAAGGRPERAFASFERIPRLTYDLIMADPPWRFSNWSPKGEGRNAVAHYACMSLEDIAALPVAHLARGDCLLWLWATNPMLPQALAVMDAWGFRYVTAGHWAKLTVKGKPAFGTGYVLRSAGEPFLIGAIGKPQTSRSVRSVIWGKVREHSRKPEEGYAAAETLMPHARRLELFSREMRPGWDVFGDEVGIFGGGA